MTVHRRDRKGRIRRSKDKQPRCGNTSASDHNDPSNQISYEHIQDLLTLVELKEDVIREVLDDRYAKDYIYTFVGPILIAINPYKSIQDLYSEKKMKEYHGKPSHLVSPHVFVLADQAYSELVHSDIEHPYNQSIIISGESGSGKTETMKIIMQYLARLTTSPANNQTQDSHDHHHDNNQKVRTLGKLEERVLETNPLLESFGNAKTLRNDNSSRFGKFCEIQFDHHGRIVGAEIVNFLLEKTRLITQNEGERNYHIFYQLLAGANSALRERLRLTSPEAFMYLNQSHCVALTSRSDLEDFQETLECMNVIGISNEEQQVVFEMLAVILHIGNVVFEISDMEECILSPKSKGILTFISELLQISSNDLEMALCHRELFVNGKVIIKTQTVAQAIEKRDAFAKALYSSVFTWLVSELNRTISNPTKKWGFIGVLDIYGFECYQNNSFEQLCINYANEKLQRHFNQNVLQNEQKEYDEEGIGWKHIDFQDNQDCLDLIESKSSDGIPGILIALDDVWRLKGEEANQKFVAQLHSTFGGKHQNKCYYKPKMDQAYCFGVRHYAGEVIYNAQGFNDKNNESLSDDIRKVISSSSKHWVRTHFSNKIVSKESPPLFPTNNSNAGNNNGTRMTYLRETSVGAQFRSQLQQLITTLEATKSHYIRCIKPNFEKCPNQLDGIECIRQLKYAGMMEAIRIRKAGFALREDYDIFYDDFQLLYPSAQSPQELIYHFSQCFQVGKEQWQMGQTKIFLRHEFYYKLESLSRLRVQIIARQIQKWWKRILLGRSIIIVQACARRYIKRKQFIKLQSCAALINRCVRGFLQRQKYQRYQLEYKLQCQAIVTIQSRVRGYLIRRLGSIASVLSQTELQGCGALELDHKLFELEKELEKAIATKDFQQCSHLQDQANQIRQKRKFVRTASELDASIKNIKRQLDIAIEEHDYTLCATTQQELVQLQKQRFVVDEDFSDLNAEELDVLILKLDQQQVEGTLEETFSKGDAQYIRSILKQKLVSAKQHRAKKKTHGEFQSEIILLQEKIRLAENQKQYLLCAKLSEDAKQLKEEFKSKFGTAAAPSTPTPAVMAPNLSHPTIKVSMNAQAPKLSGATFSSNNATQVLRHSEPTVQPNIPTTDTFSPLTSSNANSSLSTERTVSKLYPSKVLRIASTSTVAQACKYMSTHRMDVVIITDSSSSSMDPSTTNQKEELLGILTDTDVARHVIAKGLNPDITKVSEVMTTNVQMVQSSDSAFDALTIMLQGKFRHLPVVESTISGSTITGMLSVAKTLFDAIQRLEEIDRKTNSMLHEDPKSYALLKPFLQKLTLPTTDKILKRQSIHPRDICVPPKTTIDAISKIMLQHRINAILIADSCTSTLLGIFTSKDMVSRVIAKGLSTVTTTVDMVMTSSPDFAFHDTSILEALHLLHDGKFLHLPILSRSTQHIEGFVDVLSLTYGTFEQFQTPTEWEEFWRMTNTKMIDQDKGTTTTTKVLATPTVPIAASNSTVQKEKEGSLSQKCQKQTICSSNRTVQKLRPSKALTVLHTVSVAQVAQVMHQHRAEAALVIDAETNVLLGIITDTDITRRIIAKQLDPHQTLVSTVMTANPKWVTGESDAMDALFLMLEGQFRHLPVLNQDQTAVIGILHIGKTLYDAIRNMEKVQASSSDLKTCLMNQQHAGAGMTSENRSMEPMIAAMVDRMFSPTMETILENSQHQAPQIEGHLTIVEASQLMAHAKTAAVVIERSSHPPEHKVIVGILTPQEILSQVVALDRNPALTHVRDVMRKDVEHISVETSVLDSMHTMNDTKCFYLPVVNSRSKQVMGLVDILSLSYGSFAKGSSQEEWKTFWDTAFSSLDDDSHETSSDTNSLMKIKRSTTTPSVTSSSHGSNPSTIHTAATVVNERPVSKLRPSRAICVSEHLTLAQVAVEMRRQKVDAVLVVKTENDANESLNLSGILTDTDVLRRAIGPKFDPDTTLVRDIMTRNPKFVRPEDNALEAMSMMLDGKFRHLPVVSSSGEVSGILNIGKVLFDAIRRIENLQELNHQQEHSNYHHPNQVVQKMMSSIYDRMVSPTLHALMQQHQGQDPLLVCPQDRISEVAEKMYQAQKSAVLIVDHQFPSPQPQLLGIFTSKDLLLRVLGSNVSMEDTAIHEVMTAGPEFASPDMSVVEAMHFFHEHKFQHLPICCPSTHEILGLVDILAVSYGSFQTGKDWKAFWEASFTRQEDDTCSVASSTSNPSSLLSRRSKGRKEKHSHPPSSHLWSSGFADVDEHQDEHQLSFEQDALDDELSEFSDGLCSIGTIEEFERHERQQRRRQSHLSTAETESLTSVSVLGSPGLAKPHTFLFKVKDAVSGHVHRIRSRYDNITLLKEIVATKMSNATDENHQKSNLLNVACLQLKYKDDDGDVAILTTDASLMEAVEMAKAAQWSKIVLIVDIVKAPSSTHEPPTSVHQVPDIHAASASAALSSFKQWAGLLVGMGAAVVLAMGIARHQKK